jgi:hypothetical protein
MRSDA